MKKLMMTAVFATMVMLGMGSMEATSGVAYADHTTMTCPSGFSSAYKDVALCVRFQPTQQQKVCPTGFFGAPVTSYNGVGFAGTAWGCFCQNGYTTGSGGTLACGNRPSPPNNTRCPYGWREAPYPVGATVGTCEPDCAALPTWRWGAACNHSNSAAPGLNFVIQGLVMTWYRNSAFVLHDDYFYLSTLLCPASGSTPEGYQYDGATGTCKQPCEVTDGSMDDVRCPTGAGDDAMYMFHWSP